MNDFTLDLRKADTMDDVYDALAACMPLPPYFGRNLDALKDVLTDLSECTHLTVWYGFRQPHRMGAKFGGLLRVLRDSEEQNARLTVCLRADGMADWTEQR